MVCRRNNIHPVSLSLVAALSLLGWSSTSSAAGTWTVLSLPQQAGEVSQARAFAVDGAGNLYVADKGDYASGRIQMRDTQGNWSVIATDALGLGRTFNPIALAADAAGNLYVAQHLDNGLFYVDSVRMRDSQGNWAVIASRGGELGQVDGVSALAVDSAGNLYVGDSGDYGSGARIQKRDPRGNWSTVASASRVSYSAALAVDAADNLYVADWNYGSSAPGRLLRRDAQGTWSVIAGAGDAPGQVSGYPAALAADEAGDVYVAESEDGGNIDRIQKRDYRGNWLVIAGSGSSMGQVTTPSALAIDPSGSLYVADQPVDSRGYRHDRIQKQDTQGSWSVIASRGSGPGQVNDPAALAVDARGELYVADLSDNRIKKRDAQGNWAIVGEAGDALGQVDGPTSLAVDAIGDVYVGEFHYDPATGTYSGRIQKRDGQGDWSTILIGGDGPGQVIAPTALAVGAGGSLYVAEVGGRIEKREAQGSWSVLATDTRGYITGLALDLAGNLYVADDTSVQKRDAQGNLKLIRELDEPSGLAVDGAGNLYAAVLNGIVTRDPLGNWSEIDPPDGFEPSDEVSGLDMAGLAIDPAGSLYISDPGHNRVLKYSPGP